MARRGLGGGLTLAGVLVVLIGLGVVTLRALEIPRDWMPVVAGTVLVAIGAALRTLERRRSWRRR